MKTWDVHVEAPRDQWIRFPGFGLSPTGHQLRVEAETREEAREKGLAESMYPMGRVLSVEEIVLWKVRFKLPALPTKKRPREMRKERMERRGLRGGMVVEYMVKATNDRDAARRAERMALDNGLGWLRKEKHVIGIAKVDG